MVERSKLWRDDEAAVAVEFAFILPLLIVMFMGTVHFGLVVYRTQMLEAAVREGARFASVGASTADVQARVEASAVNFAPEEIPDVTIETRSGGEAAWAAGGCAERGDDVRVTIVAVGDRLKFDIPFLGSFEPDYSASATFRCEAT